MPNSVADAARKCHNPTIFGVLNVRQGSGGACAMNRTSRLLSLTLFAVVAPEFSASQDLVVFDDTGENGFSFCVSNPQNYLVESNIVHSGSAAVECRIQGDPYIYATIRISHSVTMTASAFGLMAALMAVNQLSWRLPLTQGAKWRAPTWHHFMADHCQRINGCKSKASFPECLFTETWTPSAPEFNRLTFYADIPGTNPYYVDDIVLTAVNIFKNGFECSDPSSPTC